MGANLIDGGCTFRAWAPRASAVYAIPAIAAPVSGIALTAGLGTFLAR